MGRYAQARRRGGSAAASSAPPALIEMISAHIFAGTAVNIVFSANVNVVDFSPGDFSIDGVNATTLIQFAANELVADNAPSWPGVDPADGLDMNTLAPGVIPTQHIDIN